MTSYRVANRLGLFVNGRQHDQGQEVDLDDDQAAPLLAAGIVEKASSRKAVQKAENKSAPRRRR